MDTIKQKKLYYFLRHKHTKSCFVDINKSLQLYLFVILNVIYITAGVITHLQVSLPGSVTLCFDFNSYKVFYTRSHLVNGF